MFSGSKGLCTLASWAAFLKHIKVLLITAEALNVMTPSFITTQVIKLQKAERVTTGEQPKEFKTGFCFLWLSLAPQYHF